MFHITNMGTFVKNIVLVVSFCLQIVPVLSKEIKQLWPLDSQTCESEVLLDTFQYKPVCNHREFHSRPTGFPFRSMVFNGTSPVDVRVGFTTTINEHYSVQGFFYFTDYDGVLFHYKADEPHREAILYFENGKFCLYRKVSSTRFDTYTKSVSISLHTWYYISFGIGSLGLVLQGHVNGTYHLYGALGHRDSQEVPGNLRIGGESNGTKPNFNGLITCVGFILGIHNGWISELLNQCKSTPWMGNTIHSANSSYLSYTNDKEMFLQPVYSAKRCSLVQCAYSCLRDSRCFYVSYNETDSGCNMCHLFSRIEQASATSRPLTLYHKVKP